MPFPHSTAVLRRLGAGKLDDGVAAVALAAVLAGTIGTAAQLGPDELSPMAAASWRSLLGAVGLLAVSTLRRQAPWRYRLPVRWVVLGGLGSAVTQLAFFVAADRTGVAVATLAAIGAAPLAAGLLDWMAAGQRPSRYWLGGVAVALAGVILLAGGAMRMVGSGVALAVLAGCGIPCQGFAAQKLMMDRPPLTAMATVVGGGTMVLFPAALMETGSALGSTAAMATVVYLGLITLTLGHTLFGLGLKRLRLGTVVVVGLLEPAVAATLAMVVLTEPVTTAQLGGICLVLAGVAIAAVDPTARPGKPRQGHTGSPPSPFPLSQERGNGNFS
ncbi:MAG: DMT family transporter [Synechococcus sp. SB0662_bin_45]|nr:DMT family transporter [Synechococcus sp. SB0668_bin_13]MYE21370.1 DMT family transporter [Synechococcus sp. SB0662_bin_45]